MAERQHILHWGGACGFLAALILTAMMALGLAAGPDSTELLQPTDPARISDLMSEYGDVVKTNVVLDDLFALAYTGAFLGLAALVWTRSRWLASIAMVFALATAILDFTENARLMTMALGIGGTSRVWSPLANVILFGLLVATFLTLFAVPCLYSLLFYRKPKRHRQPKKPAVKELDGVVY